MARVNPRPEVTYDASRGLLKIAAYAVDRKAGVRFRINEVALNSWGFEAKPVRRNPLSWYEMPEAVLGPYRSLVMSRIGVLSEQQTQAFREGTDRYISQHMTKTEELMRDALETMADWPDDTVGDEAWQHELQRRRDGKQPRLYNRTVVDLPAKRGTLWGDRS